MKLFIVRCVSDASSLFAVYDQCENLLFNVVGKSGGALRKIRVLAPEGSCAVKISATPEIGGSLCCNILTPKNALAVIVKLKADEPLIKIHGEKLFFRGNILEKSFEITDVTAEVLAYHKPECGKTDRFIMEVFDDSRLLSFLSIALCVDLLSFSDSALMCRA